MKNKIGKKEVLLLVSLLAVIILGGIVYIMQKDYMQLPTSLATTSKAQGNKFSIDRSKNTVYWPVNGWKESSPDNQGMDIGKLSEADEYIKRNSPYFHSLLVIRHGCIVFERYYNGYTKDDIHNIKSVSKSVLSALTGIALEKGYLNSINQKLEEFYPEYFTKDTDPLKREISIEHMLTMSAGFKWDTNGPYEMAWQESNNWYKHAIDSPLVSKPEENFLYNTGLTHLLAGIIARSSGMSTLEFANKYLFLPLGISKVRWDKDPQGNYIGGFEVYLTPRDMAKFGYLYLNNGYWNGKQIVSANWVKESIQKRFELLYGSGDYGYLWWLRTIDGHTMFFASGYGGQYIFVIPDLDLVVVTTSNCVDFPQSAQNEPIKVLKQYIVPSIIDKTPVKEQETVKPLSSVNPIKPEERDYWPTNGWRVSIPQKQGVDPVKLALAQKSMEKAMPDLHSLLIIKGGYIIAEQYYQGYIKNDANNLRSASKGIMSMLIGIAVKEKYINSIDQRIEEFYPEYFNNGTEPEKREITIKTLLTMTAGLKWTEDGDIDYQWQKSDDWLKFTLDLPMESKPGDSLKFNTSLTHLLSGLISRASNMNTKEFAQKFLFDPLGITKVKWDTDPKGYYIGGRNLYLTPRDMAKLGYLYLNNGSWDGKQVIPEKWIKESTSKKIETSNIHLNYGYLWFNGNIGKHSFYYTSGYNGQCICILPELDMVVVTTADDRDGLIRQDPLPEIIQNIVPCVNGN